jgi:TetR/AcrR family transcriptional regulator, lmrAB and yxaGH operons repressor
MSMVGASAIHTKRSSGVACGALPRPIFGLVPRLIVDENSDRSSGERAADRVADDRTIGYPAKVRPSRTSRQEILQKLSGVFRRDGYTGASLADLAGAVGLGKASLYQKFPDGKVQMGAEVLAEIGRSFETEVLSSLTGPGSVETRFAGMLAGIRKFYEDGKLSCALDALSLGEAGRLYREALLAAITQWQEALTTLGREAGLSPAKAIAWAEEVVINVEGSLVLARAANDSEIFRRTLKRLGRSLADRQL